MDLVRLLVAVIVAAAVYGGWRVYRYPGGWAYAFSRSHAGDRADLDGARRAARELDRAARRERRDAHRQLQRERTRHRGRERDVERRIAELRRPGPGTMIGQFGGMTLHERSVTLDGRQIPLADMKIRVEHKKHQHVLHLTESGGRVRVRRYARDDHDEDSVRRFAARLEEAVADANAARVRSAALLQQAEEDLAHIRADTRAQDEAQARIAEVEERQRRDTRRQAAQKQLDAARDRWKELTGRRPR